MRRGFAQLWQRVSEDSLLRNGLYIMAKTAAPALIGFGFWIVAARLLSADDVGHAAALVSTILLISVFTNLGLGQVYISRLAGREPGYEWSLTVSTGLLLVGAASLIGGALALVLLALLIPSIEEGVEPAALALVPLGVAAAAWFLVLDHVFIAERQARPAFVRNAAAALLRLAMIGLVTLVPVDGVTWIVLAWVSAFLLFDLHAVIRELPALGHEFRPVVAGWRGELSAIGRLVVGHHAINLGAQTIAYVLPLLVTARLGAEQNAYFYVTLLLASSITFIAPAISDSLFAEGAHHPDRLGANLRRAVRHTAALALPPAVVLLVAGPWILSAFGPDYADAGSAVLRILVGAAVFNAGMILAIAVLRVRGQLRDGAAATFAALVVAVAATWFLLPPLGLEGAGYGWALGSAAGMALAVGFTVRGRPGGVRVPAGAETVPDAPADAAQKARRV